RYESRRLSGRDSRLFVLPKVLAGREASTGPKPVEQFALSPEGEERFLLRDANGPTRGYEVVGAACACSRASGVATSAFVKRSAAVGPKARLPLVHPLDWGKPRGSALVDAHSGCQGITCQPRHHSPRAL